MGNTLKAIVGTALIVLGVIIGLYVGIWWSFIGGIVDVITQVRAEHLSAYATAVGVAKIFLAGFFGWISAIAFLIPGFAFLKSI